MFFKRLTLEKKLAAMAIFVAVFISCITLLFSYTFYHDELEKHTLRTAKNLAGTVADIMDAREISYYLQSGQADARYTQVQHLLDVLRRNNDMDNLYIFVPSVDGYRAVFGTDLARPGLLTAWPEALDNFKPDIIGGQETSGVIDFGERGRILSVYEPIASSSGEISAYVGMEFPMDALYALYREYFFILILFSVLLSAATAMVYLLIKRRIILDPLHNIVEAADTFIEARQIADTASAEKAVEIQANADNDIARLAAVMSYMHNQLDEYMTNLDQVKKKAEKDVLTDLLNRASFQCAVDDFISQEERPDEIHAFFMVDVDHFKTINDTYGHGVGDAMLIECARTLSSIFRCSDYVARIGGDEFAVFCMNAGSPAIIQRKAMDICEAFCAISAPDGCCKISASVGIAVVDYNEKSTFEKLYEDADAALYRCKNEGRNRFAFHQVHKQAI